MEKRPTQGEEADPKRIVVRDRRKLRMDEAEETGAALEGDSTEASSSEQQSELEGAQSQAASYLEDLQRLKAEFENFRKRMLKEQTDVVERAAALVVKKLLGILDNFDLAVSAAEGTRDFDRMLKGIEMVYGEFKEVLRSEGLEEIKAKGELFDPNYHEAALEVVGDGEGDPHVAEILRPGYTFKGRVLRPAMVKVSHEGHKEEG